MYAFGHQMADSEKLMALKKAYAEIILNTAKEAAARIMVSERKAVRYQQDLLTAKDDALRMLLRLKHMMDSKVRDAEITSLNQKKKIEELEAQLQEAEDIVKDLREELEEVQAELEKVTNNQLQSLEEPKLRCDTYVPEEMLQENGINISGPTVIPITNSKSALVASSDMRTSTFGKKYEGNNFCSTNDSQVDSCYAHNSDLASIVIRSKEPELYRNGCTQRIRACERNLLDGKLSLSEQINDVKNETAVRGEVGKERETLTVKVDVSGAEKNSDIFKSIKEYEDSVPSQAVKSFRRKRKRATRQKKGKTPPSFRCIPDQVTETLQPTDISCSKTIYSIISDHQSVGNSSKSVENEAQKDLESSLVPESPSEAREIMIQPVYIEGSEKDSEALTNKPELSRQEIAKAGNSEILRNGTDVEPVKEISAISDVSAPHLDEELPSQRPDNRFLKYTFRRKRKREPLNSSDGNSSLDNGTVKKKITEKQNGSLETEKSTLGTESSRQSRRLAQVARQLISLSGKKW